MSSTFNVNFLSHHSKKNFEDYYLQITEIFVCTANTILLDETLNIQNSKFSNGSFSLSGEGFKGYKVSLRMEKGSQLDEGEITEYVSQAISKVYSKLKTA
jgi:hypothetical protein